MNKQKIMEHVEKYILEHRADIVEDLKTLVRIPSVSAPEEDGMPYGVNCALALNKALDMMAKRGFEANNHGYKYGTAYYGGEKLNHGLIGIFSHLDVVEAGEGWTYNPFEPIEKNDFLIGRGAGDNKSGAIIGIYTMQVIKALHIPVKSNIMVFFGCNEETTMQDVELYTQEQIQPDYSMVPDLYFPVCYGEKGGLKVEIEPKEGFRQITSILGGKAENMVPHTAIAKMDFEEGLYDELVNNAKINADIEITEENNQIVVTGKGVGGHSSLPIGTINAINVLCNFLAKSTHLNKNDRELCQKIESFTSSTDGSSLGIECSDEVSGKLNCVATKITQDDTMPKLFLNIRYPVTDYRERIEVDLTKKIAPMGFAISSVRDNAPLYMSVDDEYIQTLMKVYKDATGKDNKPYVIDGGTYARKLKNAVGFGGGNGVQADFLPEGHGGVHRPDEARSIQGILDAIKIYVMSVLEIDELIQRKANIKSHISKECFYHEKR